MAVIILGVGTIAVSHCPVATERLKISCLAVPTSGPVKTATSCSEDGVRAQKVISPVEEM
jgi:hypothetical protein